MKKTIAATLGIIGCIIVLGTAGSLDVDSITFTQGIYQMAVGLGCLFFVALMSRNETY